MIHQSFTNPHLSGRFASWAGLDLIFLELFGEIWPNSNARHGLFLKGSCSAYVDWCWLCCRSITWLNPPNAQILFFCGRSLCFGSRTLKKTTSQSAAAQFATTSQLQHPSCEAPSELSISQHTSANPHPLVPTSRCPNLANVGCLQDLSGLQAAHGGTPSPRTWWTQGQLLREVHGRFHLVAQPDDPGIRVGRI